MRNGEKSEKPVPSTNVCLLTESMQKEVVSGGKRFSVGMVGLRTLIHEWDHQKMNHMYWLLRLHVSCIHDDDMLYVLMCTSMYLWEIYPSVNVSRPLGSMSCSLCWHIVVSTSGRMKYINSHSGHASTRGFCGPSVHHQQQLTQAISGIADYCQENMQRSLKEIHVQRCMLGCLLRRRK